MDGKAQSQEIARLYRDYVNPDLARVMRITGLGTLEDHASGCHVWDHEGHQYLDMAGGYGMFALGHCHPEVIEAVSEQLHKMPLSAKVFFTPAMAYLAEALAKVAPGDLRYTFFSNTGTEAVECALKVARLARPQRNVFVAALGAFHGKTLGALSVSGRPKYREPFEPLVPEVRHVDFNDPKALSEAVDEHTAAVILEPVQGEGGIHLATQEFMEQARQACDQHQALLITDEVQTGMGRTGKMFAIEHYGIKPDIMCLAKALGGGVMPIGATMGTPEVWKAFKGRPLIHTSTFGGNPLACTAGLATLKIMERDNLPEKAAKSGAYMLQKLQDLAGQYPEMCRQARGLGLMMGMEFTEEKYAGAVIAEMSRRRVIAVYTLNQPRVIRFEPPLAISLTDIDYAIEALAESLFKAHEIFSQSGNATHLG